MSAPVGPHPAGKPPESAADAGSEPLAAVERDLHGLVVEACLAG